MKYEIVQLPKINIIGLTCLSRIEDEKDPVKSEGPLLWERLAKNPAISKLTTLEKEDIYFVYYQYGVSGPDEVRLHLGVELDHIPNDLAQGLFPIIIPAGSYALVKSPLGPLPDIVQEAWSHIETMSFDESGYKRSFKYDFEKYSLELKSQHRCQIELFLSLEAL